MPDSRVHPCARSPRSIGTIIGLNQLNFLLGINPQAIPDWHTHEHFYERVYESLKHADKAKPWNPVVFVLNVVPLLYLVKFAPKKVQLIPWHIIFVVLGIVYGYLLDAHGNPLELLLLKDRFTIDPYLIGLDASTNSTHPAFFAGVDDARFAWGGVIVASFSVSVIAILETQIAAKILDSLTHTAFDSKREVFGTAACNLAAGLAGGMPICGAMARMTLNANCGARSRTSIVINGFTVLVVMFAVMPLFRCMHFRSRSMHALRVHCPPARLTPAAPIRRSPRPSLLRIGRTRASQF